MRLSETLWLMQALSSFVFLDRTPEPAPTALRHTRQEGRGRTHDDVLLDTEVFARAHFDYISSRFKM